MFFFHSFCATDFDFGTKNNGRIKQSTLKTLIFSSYGGSLLNFVKRYEDDKWVIFDQWQELHLGLDALSNQKVLKGVYNKQLS